MDSWPSRCRSRDWWYRRRRHWSSHVSLQSRIQHSRSTDRVDATNSSTRGNTVHHFVVRYRGNRQNAPRRERRVYDHGSNYRGSGTSRIADLRTGGTVSRSAQGTDISYRYIPVSYTHLTLPTIYSV